MSSILTVSQLMNYLKFKLDSDIKLRGAALKGELSDFKIHYKSGHAYFTVKDEESAVSGVMFAGSVHKLRGELRDGMTVLVIGDISVYKRTGACQIIATQITSMGTEGSVAKRTEEVRERLAKLGVFDASAKKSLPAMPSKIAFVGSGSSAALQDIISVLSRRCPICKLEIFPALTQGTEAPQSLCRAIERAGSSGADTIIVARGGGSSEDLSPYNDERTVMAVFNSPVPIISAVGHETDTTLCDYAADLRAPTPSAAAELVVPDRTQLMAAIRAAKERLYMSVVSIVEEKERELAGIRSLLGAYSPDIRLSQSSDRLEQLSARLRTAMEGRLRIKTLELTGLHDKLEALSPFHVLERGYALVEMEGRAVTNAELLDVGDRVSLRMNGGHALTEIIEVKKDTESTGI